MANNDIAKDYDNFQSYESKIKTAFDKEKQMFDKFHRNITLNATSHINTTLNNLKESKESLLKLKKNAALLKDSVFFHEETVIVDRQKIISQTETKIHKENLNVLNYEYAQAGERIDSLDYLNKALIQTKYNFFDQFKIHYANQILNYDYLYIYFEQKTKEFDKILDKYFNQIKTSFNKLNSEISEMDSTISVLITKKNTELDAVTKFYEKEMENYLDNQLTFSVEDDSTSLTVQALISDKISQLDRFKNHLFEQESKARNILHNEYLEIYNKTLDRLLKEKGNELIDDVFFFYHPDMTINDIKIKIVAANDNSVIKKKLIKKYNKLIKYKKEKESCIKRAKNMTKHFEKLKKEIFLEYQKENRSLILEMEKYYKLYLELLKIDPFLAQVIGDNSTKIIKDEVNFLSLLKMNKEYKINIDFDIKTLRLKQQINEIESKLKYQTDKLLFSQDKELLDIVKDIELYFANHSGDSDLIKYSLIKEKYIIEKLDTAISHHMQYLVKETNTNRKFLSLITQILLYDIRENETHDIHVVDATSKIKLALKEYDILALHFNTMYENEKRFLVSQSTRVSEEQKINNEFILTTFENQMRFSSEQIALAKDEYRLRIESIIKAIEEERNYYYDVIKNKTKQHLKDQSKLDDEYQARLYHNSYILSGTKDKKYIRNIEKDMKLSKKNHDLKIAAIEEEIFNDQEIFLAKKNLEELNMHFEQAVDDAKELMDKTIEEMSSLYQEAEKKHALLKPYLENKVNILEPTFFNTLEKTKKRYHYKLKKAEIILENSTKNLIENFKKISFETKPSINKDLYLAQIEQLEEERRENKATYQDLISKSDEIYHNKILSLNNNIDLVVKNSNILRDNIISRNKKTLQQIDSALKSLENRFENDKLKRNSNFQNEINTLANEYNKSNLQNQKYHDNLSTAFDTILNSYYPYLKVAKNNKVIKQIVKQNNNKINSKKSKEFKDLKRDSKKLDYLSKIN